VVITPTGYKIIDSNIRQHPRTYQANKLQPTKKWTAMSTRHITCNIVRKLETTWKRGSALLIGTYGGLKDQIGTTGVVIESCDDTKTNIKTWSAETAPVNNLHSTREEFQAILSAELLLEKIGSAWGHKNIDITLVSDSTSALHFVDKTTIPS